VYLLNPQQPCSLAYPARYNNWRKEARLNQGRRMRHMQRFKGQAAQVCKK
jgi:hypothetical protein